MADTISERCIKYAIHDYVDDAKSDKDILLKLQDYVSVDSKINLMKIFKKQETGGKLEAESFHKLLKEADIDISKEKAIQLIKHFDIDNSNSLHA